MKKVLSFVLIALVTLFSASVVIGFFLPTSYEVVRSIRINAKPHEIHQFAGDLSRWELWAPWKDADPSVVTTIGTKTKGIGASQSWTGKDGVGSLEFTASDPNRGIEYDLFFDQGAWKSKAALEYAETQDTQTLVVWKMWGSANAPVVGGYIALLMDRMAGPMFLQGLEKLKLLVESSTEAPIEKGMPS